MKKNHFIPRFFIFISLLVVPFITAQAVPVNVALNKVATADSRLSAAYPVSKAVDGNSTSDDSRWVSSNGMPHWIELDLGQSYVLSQMKFWTGKNSVGAFPLYDFSLQTWDGTDWVDLHSVVDSTNTGAVDESFAPVVAGNRVRLHVTRGEDGIVRLFELQLMGEPHGLTFSSRAPEPNVTHFDPSSNLVVTFSAPIQLLDASGIRVKNLSTATDLTGTSISVSGNELIISHGGLDTLVNYAVHIPANRVALASDATVGNGAIHWTFDTAPLKPQLESYSKEIPNLTDDIVLQFDRELSLLDGSGITLRRTQDDTLLTGLNASVSGNSLSIAHPELNLDESYILSIPQNTVAGTINGAGNAEIRRIVFAGIVTLFNATFTDGNDGFQFGKTINGWSGSRYWERVTNGIGPSYDSYYIEHDTRHPEDYVLSPLVSLSAEEEYTLDLAVFLDRDLHLALATTLTPDLANLEPFVTLPAVVGGGIPQSKRVKFTPPSSGNFYIVFYSGNTNPYQTQQLDSIVLTRSIAPVVRILTPDNDASINESDSQIITVEAYGVAAPMQTLKLYDDTLPGDQLLGIPTADGEAFIYPWAYHLPGTRTLTAEIVDQRSNRASDSVSVTVNFDDGTLPQFIGYDFDDQTPRGWTSTPAADLRIFNSSGNPGFKIGLQAASSNNISFSSPSVNLFAGEPYTLSLRSHSIDTKNYQFGMLVTTATGYPADTTDAQNFTITPTWNTHTFTFTVPYDGSYHITLFDKKSQSYTKVEFDDIRIIGNNNALPVVSLLSPTNTIKTVQGVDLTLKASAIDPDGTIAKVEFYRDAFKLGEVTQAPYNFVWENVVMGSHNVFARAHDSNGAIQDTPSVAVNVVENKWSIATFVGNTSDTDETFTGTAYASDGTLILAGKLDPTLFPGATPTYLNGTAPGDRGVIALLSEDGSTVKKVVVVASQVWDIDLDDNDRIYVAAGSAGALVLDATASTVLWSQSYGTDKTHRIDAAGNGTFAVLNSPINDFKETKLTTSTNYVYDSSFNPLGSMGGASAFTTDVAVDAVSQTVIFIGWKNYSKMEPPPSEPGAPEYPVDIPAIVGRAYDGTLKYRAYDWEKQDSGDRWLNRITNNMADTRGARLFMGADGYFYAGIEFDGGNTPLRYDPFDLGITAQDRIVGGGGFSHHGMAGTSTVPKTFVGRYNPGTGDFIFGQWITNRLDNGSDNTIRIETGNIAVDAAGRIHVVGHSASGLPLTMDNIPNGLYTGGAYHLVYSPDFAQDEHVTRLSFLDSDHHAIAVSPNGKVAIAGTSSRIYNFTTNAWQDAPAGGDHSQDAFFSVLDPSDYYSFQTGAHPRLFFDAAEVPALREKVTREPYASMKQRMITMLELDDVFRPYNAGDMKQVIVRAQQEAFLYIITGDEAWAQAARANVNTVINTVTWADPALRGLDSYWYASKTAMAYDWCATSEAWDSAFNYKVSKALLDIGKMIITNGGSDQSPSAASNWQASRGASGALALLASDHNYNADLINQGYDKVWAYLNANMGNASTTRGWNPEGLGYTYFPNGNYVGPFGIAMARHNPAKDIRDHVGLRMSYWSVFAGITPAVDVYNFGGVKNDWSDDNAHIRGEGTYNQAFYYAPENLKPGIKFWYDRMMGFDSDDVDDAPQKRWDSTRGGAIWGILYYPQEVDAQQPTEIWDWHQANDDKGGIGMFTFRNTYADPHDFLAQFKTRLVQVDPSAHDGPDGLGFRIIGNGAPWVIGGGRTTPGRNIGQAGLYTTEPLSSPTVTLSNTGSIHGTPLIRPDGGGHVIASMVNTNVGVSNHKRWFVASYDSTQTGVDAAYLVADTSTDGAWWQLPTHLHNTVTITGSSTFTITAPNGATLQGTVLYPTSGVNITTGTMVRGDGYAMNNGGSIATADAPINDTRIEENKYIRLNHAEGDFLVTLTIQSPGDSHPTPALQSGTVADATVSIGSLVLNLQTDNVLYNGAPYTPPTATVTFDAGIGGSITSGNAVQSVSYGAAATEPTLSVSPGFTFVRWDRAFDAVVKDMTVRAVYYDETGNVAPTVNGGGSRTVTVNTPVTLNGSVSDDGLPNPRGFTTTQWAQLSGPSTAQFLNATVPNPTVQFPETGTYVLRITADDGVATSQDDVTVTVTPTPGPGFLRFTSDAQTLNESDGSVTVYVERYNGGEGAIAVNYSTGDSTALAGSDYTTVAGTLSWGDGETDIKSITVPILEDMDVENTEVFVITLSQPTNGAQVGTIGITAVFIEDNDVNSPPNVTITSPIGGSAVLPHHNLRLVLEAEVSDDGQPGPVATTWSKVSGQGTVSFDSIAQRNTTVKFSQPGDYVLKILAHDGMSGDFELVTVSVMAEGGNPDLEMHWTFDETSGSTVADERNNHSGTAVGAVEWLSGHEGGAIKLNLSGGSTAYEYVDSDSPIAFSTGAVCSASVWFQLNQAPSSNSTRKILQQHDGSGSGRSWLGIVNESGTYKLSSYLGGSGTVGGSVTLNTWHHAALVATGTKIRLYLNGALVAETTQAVEANSAFFRIGNHKPTNSVDSNNQWIGSVDDLRIYKRALSESEIALLTGGSGSNVGPDVFAGNANTATADEAVTLAGTVSDDGLPLAPGAVSLLWTKRDGLGSVSFTDATHAAPQATFGTAGTYILRLVADDGAIKTAHDVTYTVATGVLTPAETWRQTHFGIIENSGNAASDADPDGDGLVNLLERALGGDPLQAASAPLPTLTQIADGVDTYLRLTVNREADATDLTYVVEVSEDLVSWSSVEGTDIVTITNTANTLEVRDATPISPANPKRFLRLRVME